VSRCRGHQSPGDCEIHSSALVESRTAESVAPTIIMPSSRGARSRIKVGTLALAIVVVVLLLSLGNGGLGSVTWFNDIPSAQQSSICVVPNGVVVVGIIGDATFVVPYVQQVPAGTLVGAPFVALVEPSSGTAIMVYTLFPSDNPGTKAHVACASSGVRR